MVFNNAPARRQREEGEQDNEINMTENSELSQLASTYLPSSPTTSPPLRSDSHHAEEDALFRATGTQLQNKSAVVDRRNINECNDKCTHLINDRQLEISLPSKHSLDNCNKNIGNKDTARSSVPSNESLLGTAFVTFMGFALFQMIFAVFAESEAMVGDSSAMIVDAFTYLFNWVAERRKNLLRADGNEMESSAIDGDNQLEKGGSEDAVQHKRNRADRKRLLQLEVIPPIISVTALLLLTVFVLKKAIGVLVLDTHRNRSEQTVPNLNVMLTFSALNLVLDFVNVYCFARAKHLFGYNTHITSETVFHHHHHYHELEQNLCDEEPGTLSVRTLPQDVLAAGSKVGNRQLNYYEATALSPPSTLPSSPGSSWSTLHFDKDNSITMQTDLHPIPDDTEENVYSNSIAMTAPIDNRSTASSLLDNKLTFERVQCCNEANVPRFAHDIHGGENKHSHGSIAFACQENYDVDDSEENSEDANMNMCSAYTHVFADTLRSIAVILAALVAKCFNGVTSEEADATAAVIVSILIVLSLIPLFQGLFESMTEWYAIQAEEEQEKKNLLAIS